MIEVSSDPVEAKRQMSLHNKMRLRKDRIGDMYTGMFRSDFEAVIQETIQNLKNEVAEWEKMLEE